MAALKAATAEAHLRLESAPFFQTLTAGELPVESYVGHLRALAVIHAVLDSALEASHDPRAAVEAFSGIEVIIAALYPFKPDSRTFLVTSINPEAGRHAVPAHPRELEASLRAGDRCWERFPYFEHRILVGGQALRWGDVSALDRYANVSRVDSLDHLEAILGAYEH